MIKKQVLFLTNIPSPYRVSFFNELGRYSDLTVCFEGKNATDRDESWKSFRAETYKEVFLRGFRTKSDGFLCVDIVKYLKQKWDIIIVGGYSTPTQMLAIEYMRFHKIPFVLEVDGGIIRQDSSIIQSIKKHYISSASWWFSSGDKTDEYLIYYGADKNRCYHYPFTSINNDDIKKAAILRKDKNNIMKQIHMSPKHNVITVGQFIHRKGFDILLNAIPMIKHEIECYIIGGTPTDDYKNIIKRLRLTNIKIIPFLTKRELALYYAASDLFVLPTREDIWGLVINEAMSFGLPIVTTECCVAGMELVKDNGFIIQSDDPSSLAKAIDSSFDNPQTLITMGEKSFERIQTYSIEKMASRHAELFDVIFRQDF